MLPYPLFSCANMSCPSLSPFELASTIIGDFRNGTDSFSYCYSSGGNPVVCYNFRSFISLSGLHWGWGEGYIDGRGCNAPEVDCLQESWKYGTKFTFTVPAPEKGEKIVKMNIFDPYVDFEDSDLNYYMNGVKATGNILISYPWYQWPPSLSLYAGSLQWDVTDLIPTFGENFTLTGGIVNFELTGSEYRGVAEGTNALYDLSGFCYRSSSWDWKENEISNSTSMTQVPPLLTITYACAQNVYTMDNLQFSDPNSNQPLTPPVLAPYIPYKYTDGPTPSNRTIIIAQITQTCFSNGQTDISNKAIKFTILPPTTTAETGDHIDSLHTAPRPVGTFDNGDTTEECVTDANGSCSVEYTAPQVSGIYTIHAELEAEPSIQQEAKVTVQIGGIGQLSDSTGYYRLKCFEEPYACKNYGHIDFYGVQSWVDGMWTNTAEDYTSEFPKAPLLVVTDGSLGWGGLYDYEKDWRPPHKYHRTGTDIDVRSHNIPTSNREKFVEKVCKYSGFPLFEYADTPIEHYHISFYQYYNMTSLCESYTPNPPILVQEPKPEPGPRPSIIERSK